MHISIFSIIFLATAVHKFSLINGLLVPTQPSKAKVANLPSQISSFDSPASTGIIENFYENFEISFGSNTFIDYDWENVDEFLEKFCLTDNLESLKTYDSLLFEEFKEQLINNQYTKTIGDVLERQSDVSSTDKELKEVVSQICLSLKMEDKNIKDERRTTSTSGTEIAAFPNQNIKVPTIKTKLRSAFQNILSRDLKIPPTVSASGDEAVPSNNDDSGDEAVPSNNDDSGSVFDDFKVIEKRHALSPTHAHNKVLDADSPLITTIIEPTYYYDIHGVHHIYSQKFKEIKTLAETVPKGFIGLGSLTGTVGVLRVYQTFTTSLL